MEKSAQRELRLWLRDRILHALNLNYSIKDIASILQVSEEEIQKVQDSRCCSEEPPELQPPW